MIVGGLSANLTLPDYGWFARDTTKCVSAAQQRVARRRSQLTTTDTVADTAICACRMQRQGAEGQCPPTISSGRPTCRIQTTSKTKASSYCGGIRDATIPPPPQSHGLCVVS